MASPLHEREAKMAVADIKPGRCVSDIQAVCLFHAWLVLQVDDMLELEAGIVGYEP